MGLQDTELDKNSTIPLYAQIEDILLRRLNEGVWGPGQRISSEAELQREFGVSRMTVRGVLNSLVADGLLQRVPGKGTFVAEPKITTHSPSYQGIREQLERLGFQTQTKLVKLSQGPANKTVRSHLKIGPDENVFHIVRLRSIENTPVSLHRSWVPVSLAPSLPRHDVVGEQLCTVMSEEFGFNAYRTTGTLEAVGADSEESKLLQCPKGTPLILLEDTIEDLQGLPFEYTKVLLRGDQIKLHHEYWSTEQQIHG